MAGNGGSNSISESFVGVGGTVVVDRTVALSGILVSVAGVKRWLQIVALLSLYFSSFENKLHVPE